ncbi:hypothetical protein S83_015276, partial [Arachis hypogaea]
GSTQKKQNIKSLSDASKPLQWDDTVNSVVVNSKSVGEVTNPKFNGENVGEAGLFSSKCVSRTNVDPHKDICYCTSDLENKDTGSTWKPSV